MEATYHVYQDKNESFFVSKSGNWANDNSPLKKIAVITAESVRKATPHCKTPIEVGGVGVTTNGTTVKVKSVTLI